MMIDSYKDLSSHSSRKLMLRLCSDWCNNYNWIGNLRQTLEELYTYYVNNSLYPIHVFYPIIKGYISLDFIYVCTQNKLEKKYLSKGPLNLYFPIFFFFFSFNCFI